MKNRIENLIEYFERKIELFDIRAGKSTNRAYIDQLNGTRAAYKDCINELKKLSDSQNLLEAIERKIKLFDVRSSKSNSRSYVDRLSGGSRAYREFIRELKNIILDTK